MPAHAHVVRAHVAIQASAQVEEEVPSTEARGGLRPDEAKAVAVADRHDLAAVDCATTSSSSSSAAAAAAATAASASITAPVVAAIAQIVQAVRIPITSSPARTTPVSCERRVWLCLCGAAGKCLAGPCAHRRVGLLLHTLS